MRSLNIYFAWYFAADSSVDDGDLEDFHSFEDAESIDSIADYIADEIGWFGLPSIDGKSYVCDEVEFEELSFESSLRVRYATLEGFSENELQVIAEKIKSR